MICSFGFFVCLIDWLLLVAISNGDRMHWVGRQGLVDRY